jgi:hypothetical protein
LALLAQQSDLCAKWFPPRLLLCHGRPLAKPNTHTVYVLMGGMSMFVPHAADFAGACALHPRRGHCSSSWWPAYRRTMQARAPCTRSRWAAREPPLPAPCTPAGAIAFLCATTAFCGLCRRLRPAPAAGGRCPLHPRWGRLLLNYHYRMLRAQQALAPCTRSRWALPPAPPLGPLLFFLVAGVSPDYAGACALHPQQVGAAPCTPAGAISFPQTP